MTDTDSQSPIPTNEPAEAAAKPEPVKVVTSDKPVSSASTAPPHAATAPKSELPKSAASGRSGFGLLLSLLLVLGLAGVGFYSWEQDKAIQVLFGQYNELVAQRSATQGQLAGLENSRQQLEQRLQEQLQEQLQSTQAALSAQATQLETLNRELINTRLRITDSGAGASQSWMLMEAESLLRFAQQRLLLAHDVRAAIGLYIASDDLLKQINDPAVFSVREALAVDLAALQAVREVDVPGLFARLGAVISGLDNLQVQAGGERPAFQVTQPGAASEGQTWWESTKASLSQYFVITRDANEAIPQLTTDQTWVLKEAVRLNLEQARVALLRAQPELFAQALQQAYSSIDTLMQGSSKAALLAELDTLKGTAIVTVVPASNLGLRALRQLQPETSSAAQGNN